MRAVGVILLWAGLGWGYGGGGIGGLAIVSRLIVSSLLTNLTRSYKKIKTYLTIYILTVANPETTAHQPNY